MGVEHTKFAQLVALHAQAPPHARHVQLDIIYLLVFALLSGFLTNLVFHLEVPLVTVE